MRFAAAAGRKSPGGSRSEFDRLVRLHFGREIPGWRGKTSDMRRAAVKSLRLQKARRRVARRLRGFAAASTVASAGARCVRRFHESFRMQLFCEIFDGVD